MKTIYYVERIEESAGIITVSQKIKFDDFDEALRQFKRITAEYKESEERFDDDPTRGAYYKEVVKNGEFFARYEEYCEDRVCFNANVSLYTNPSEE